MKLSSILVGALAATSASAETVLGVYILSRHGDRTAKSTPPTKLTGLGYREVFTSGTWFRNRYISSGATNPIHGISHDLVKTSQITASAPVDTVLQDSTLGFLQALYPPVGETLGSETLRNNTVVQTPLNGYQLIPLQTVSTGANSENSAWLQGATNCANAQLSSNDYFASPAYKSMYEKTMSFYKGLAPMINKTFAANQTNFKNAYTIFDLLNVASIHNSSSNFSSADLLTPDVFFQLRTLADNHEFNLAYNASDKIRAVTGSIIASQVLTALNLTLTNPSKSPLLNIQFGAYAGMQSFFGLADLTSQNVPDFFGVPDYASTLTWELVTNATVTNSKKYPDPSEVSVRFLFHNGTTSPTSTPTEYPLFGSNRSPLPWSDFLANMQNISIGDQASWCKACGNSTGVCSPYVLNNDSSPDSSSGLTGSDGNSNCGGGISKAVAGVIGAMVTLAVILGLELLVMLVAGLRLVKKKNIANQQSHVVDNGAGAKA